jgi:histidyl-tRNA synthetase
MSKIKNISGFPEWLPAQKLLEEQIIQIIQTIYKSFGFTPIETPAVELKSTLSSKGVIDKEIYLLRRALQDPNSNDKNDEDELALHFDLTVPFARYVAQHFNDLVFPFKRYQLQKVWRGERPQRGRFREFYQFDIDIVARDTLPISCDAEIISAFHKVFTALNIGKFEIRINNRKILLGLYEELGLDTSTQKQVITIVDKLDKIGIDGITKELSSVLKLSQPVIDKIVKYTSYRFPISQTENQILDLGEIKSASYKAGVEEVIRLAQLCPNDSVVFDLSLARGLDYYTGTIFEIHLPDFPEFGTVSSGGRYEDLATQFINHKLPGVGGSIGLSRLMDLIFKNNLKPLSVACPTQILFTVFSEDLRPQINKLADICRDKGIPAEVYPSAPKLGKQIEYADKKGINFCAFLDDASGKIRIKDIVAKEEKEYSSVEDWIAIKFPVVNK